MDVAQIVIQAIQLIPKFIPKPKPPVTDFKPLYEAIPNPTIQIVTQKVEVRTQPERIKTGSFDKDLNYPLTEGEMTPNLRLKTASSKAEKAESEVATACLSCTRSHLSATSGALGEALRFAREGGITNSDAQRRIMLAEDEINMLERIDLAPDALVKAPLEERQVAEEYLPRIRKLRQEIGNIASVESLQKTAAEASILGQEFRLRHLQLKGVDLNPVLELAKKVQAGEITMAEAKAKLKEILPEEA